MTGTPPDPALTLYLRDPRSADDGLAAAAVPVVYAELRALAASHLRRARRPEDLQPTALVHEVYLKLLGDRGAAVNDREHFFALAARAMRQLCVDFARARLADKRGGGQAPVTLDEALAAAADMEVDVLDLDAALTELAELDPREARVVELRFFSGLSMDEVAAALSISLATAEREWRAARAWLAQRLNAGGNAP
ncbi:MAG: sigma-70 family RNA polymerase sigma factor [Planctomycetes bacterium]|nr:sigma-70 family RNA polymerase sigma factor [Planctomycetota bacterium]MCB9885297.1 sigma-70 family RNA polymerase sigma factor [Planctomycetota bacterium]